MPRPGYAQRLAWRFLRSLCAVHAGPAGRDDQGYPTGPGALKGYTRCFIAPQSFFEGGRLEELRDAGVVNITQYVAYLPIAADDPRRVVATDATGTTVVGTLDVGASDRLLIDGRWFEIRAERGPATFEEARRFDVTLVGEP